MSITYPLSLPTDVAPVGVDWGKMSSVGQVESPYTLQQQVQEYSGERWVIDASFPRIPIESAGAWRAFFASLRGSLGTFLFGDPTMTQPQGAIMQMVSPVPRVKGGSQTGNTLTIDGLANSITNAFKAGDWIQLGSGATSRLHMVVANANTNGSGETTLTIVPALRSSPADNDIITYLNCKGVFRSPKNELNIFSTSGPSLSSFRLTGVEVV